MRIALGLCFAILSAGCGMAQSLDGSLSSQLNGGIASGLNGGISSGLASTLGSTQQGSTRAITGRRGLDYGGCAPSQLDLNHTGCRPLREIELELRLGAFSSYDQSIQAMGPLQDVILRGLTLDPGLGPAGPD